MCFYCFYKIFTYYSLQNFQVIKETFYAHAKKAREEADRIKKEKEDADKKLREIQQKKEQERLAKDFEPATVKELTEEEAAELQQDIEKDKQKGKSVYIFTYDKIVTLVYCQ